MDPETRELVKASLARVKELKAQIAELEHRMSEPIAIVGIGCRFPGGADSPDAFWTLLDARQDAVQPLEARWSLVGARPADGVPRWAGLLAGAVDGFDAGFFGISSWEAESLDPQHRLLLEVAWEALEHSGIPPRSLTGTRTGVFLGASSADYYDTVRQTAFDPQDVFCFTGSLLSVAAGRLSFMLGLQGPALTVDTACSSSLVATHLAVGSLRARESDLALAGGVNLLLSPEMMERVARLQALSPDGRCKAFDASANGFVRAEGCGLVVLKRLSDARRDGDHVWALIRGSAVNQDGRSTSMTAPNVLAQEALLRQALQNAHVEPASIGYVETHGTGTSLGDPIEVEALRTVVGPDRRDGTRCVLGAVKTNIGHLEAAAGVAGLIKATLALAHECIPANLNFRTLNPRIRLEGTALTLATETVPWPRATRPRFAGVSSFGMSGTNAHVVLEEPPAAEPVPSATSRAAELLVLSARSAEALAVQATQLEQYLAAHPDLELVDVAFSLATTRSHHDHRLAIAATSRKDLQRALEAAMQGQTAPGSARRTIESRRGRLAFLFTGQGAQVPGMGAELHATWPAFRDAFDRCVALFDGQLDRPLCEVMWAPTGSPDAARLEQTAWTQPALFALEYALVALWRSWGVAPDLVAGHSIGELVAATVAGVFSLEDAARLVAARGRLMQALPAGGAMVSIDASEAEIDAAISAGAGSVSIAAVNGPQQIVIAGVDQAVRTIAAAFAAQGRRVKALSVSHAFHSPLTEPMLESFGQVAASIAYRRPSVPLVSSLTGALVGDEVTAPSYWVRHIRETVRFADGVHALSAAGATAFVEIGPRPALLASVATTLNGAQPVLLPSLSSGRPESAGVLEALGGLWAAGWPVNFTDLFPAESRRTPLPTYPWQRTRYWLQAAAADERTALRPSRTARRENPAKLDLQDWFSRPVWRARPAGADVPSSGTDLGPQWLVFVDGHLLGAQLLERLAAQGQRVITVMPGPAYASVSGSEFTIRPGVESDYDALLTEIFNRRLRPRHIVHAWDLEDPAPDKMSFATAQDHGFYSVLSLAKALCGKHVKDEVWIEVLTRGMQAVAPDDRPVPERSTVLGCCRVIPQEHPNLRCRSVDLDPRADAADVTRLLDEFARPPLGHAIAFRGDTRLELSFERMALEPCARPRRLREHGVYLITGGLGDLGLILAEELERQVHARLILTTRSAFPEPGEWAERVAASDDEDLMAARIRRVQHLVDLGAEVLVVQADVTDEDRMTEAVAQGVARFGAIHGVIHCAGAVEETAFRMVEDTGREDSERHFGTKAHGALVLERVLGGQPLDFVLTMSSLSTVLGGLGFVSYASANVYLDALAHANRRRGAIPWISVDWDIWGVGKAGRSAARSALSDFAMTKDEGLEVFRRVLAAEDLTQVVVSTGSLDARIKQWVEQESIRESDAHGGAPAPVRSREELEQGLLQIWREVLGLEQVGVDDNYFELGGDSLLATRVFILIKERFGRTLPLATLFRAPTVASLVECLLDRGPEEPSSCLVAMKSGGSREPLFWAHGVGGDLLRYYRVVSLLDADQPVYGFHAPNEPLSHFESTAAAYLEELLTLKPEGPYQLIGYSYGGFLAYELARQLVEKGREVSFLGIVDSVMPSPIRLHLEPTFLKHVARHVASCVQTFVGLEHRVQKARVRAAWRRLARHISPPRAPNGRPVADVTEIINMDRYPEDRKRFAQVHYRALREYVPKPYAGRLTLFRATVQALRDFEPSLGWARVAREVEIVPVRGNHSDILEVRHAGALAEAIGLSLKRAAPGAVRAAT